MEIELVREGLRAAAGALAGLDVTALDAAGVRAAVGELCAVRSQAARLDVALATRAGELRASGGGEDPVDLLTRLGAMPASRARRVVRHAELLARMPTLAAALKDARLSDDHLDAVADGRRRLDPVLRPGFDAADAEITSLAVGHSPDDLTDRLGVIVRRLQRAHTRDMSLRRRRAVRVAKWVDKTGVYQLHGSFDPEMGSRIFGAIDTAVETLRQHPDAVVPGEDPNDPLGSDGEFLAAHGLARLVSHGHAVEHPGVAEVVLLADTNTVLHGEHPATVCEFGDGTPADPYMVRRLCCEAIVTAVITSADGTVPLVKGRSIRTANRDQRRMLRAVHRTCAIDGCTVPFGWCEIHHIWFWEHGGPTDLDNLVPLCLRHHHLVHDFAWRLTLNPTDRTLTVYRPDGSVYREMRPPGLRPPVDDPVRLPGEPCTTAA